MKYFSDKYNIGDEVAFYYKGKCLAGIITNIGNKKTQIWINIYKCISYMNMYSNNDTYYFDKNNFDTIIRVGITTMLCSKNNYDFLYEEYMNRYNINYKPTEDDI